MPEVVVGLFEYQKIVHIISFFPTVQNDVAVSELVSMSIKGDLIEITWLKRKEFGD